MQKKNTSPVPSAGDSQSLHDMLQELRILLQGSQLLTAFLVVLPFSDRFYSITQAEKIVYVITFACSVLSLVIFSAPAVHHRMMRPIVDRVSFKNYSSFMMIVGLIPLTIALVLASQLALSEVIGELLGTITSIFIFLVIIIVWWILPLTKKRARNFF